MRLRSRVAPGGADAVVDSIRVAAAVVAAADDKERSEALDLLRHAVTDSRESEVVAVSDARAAAAEALADTHPRDAKMRKSAETLRAVARKNHMWLGYARISRKTGRMAVTATRAARRSSSGKAVPPARVSSSIESKRAELRTMDALAVEAALTEARAALLTRIDKGLPTSTGISGKRKRGVTAANEASS